MDASATEQHGAHLSGAETAERLVREISRIIRGKEEFLRRFVTCLIAGGHVLIEDVPGLGKTTVAKTLARLVASGNPGPLPEVIGVPFRRIQFTPDLLPYDITGVDIYDPDSRRFVFQPGPIFASIVLADEINRSTPKVQSALLEVMAEHQVTVGNATHHMDELFFVMATQNPLELEGTYPLPLAQLDRFLMRLALGYPDFETEFAILKDDPSHNEMPQVQPICRKADVLRARSEAARVHCDDRLIRAVAGISRRSREDEAVAYGISPRGGLMLIAACRAYALCNGRDYVVDEDIRALSVEVLAHRLRMRDPRANAAELIDSYTRAEIEQVPHRVPRHA